MKLDQKHCIPCSEGAPKLNGQELQNYLNSVDPHWQLNDRKTKIKRALKFKDFNQALQFINQVGEIAEQQGHHPNLYLHNYNQVTVELYTHKIQGLHANDFILAYKIDHLQNIPPKWL